MKSLFSFVLVCFTVLNITHCDDSGELDIDVIKKADKCDRKSKKGDLLAMHYRGSLDDGKEFDSRYLFGRKSLDLLFQSNIHIYIRAFCLKLNSILKTIKLPGVILISIVAYSFYSWK